MPSLHTSGILIEVTLKGSQGTMAAKGERGSLQLQAQPQPQGATSGGRRVSRVNQVDVRSTRLSSDRRGLCRAEHGAQLRGALPLLSVGQPGRNVGSLRAC